VKLGNLDRTEDHREGDKGGEEARQHPLKVATEPTAATGITRVVRPRLNRAKLGFFRSEFLGFGGPIR